MMGERIEALLIVLGTTAFCLLGGWGTAQLWFLIF